MAYNVQIASLNINIRRKESGAAFSAEATVAAGGKPSDAPSAEHLSQVEVTLNPVVANYPLDALGIKPEAIYGEGIGGSSGNAKFIPKAGPIVTDAAGKAVIGYVRSSDRVVAAPLANQPDKRVTLELPTGGNAKAWVSQGISGNWFMGQNGELAWNPNALIPGQAVPIAFKTKLPNITPDLPITGHTLRFLVTRVKVRQWEDSTYNNAVERVYLLEDPDMHIPDEPGAIRANSDVLSYVAGFGVQGQSYQDANDAGGGLYKGSLVLKSNRAWALEEIQLGVKDLGAYVKK